MVVSILISELAALRWKGICIELRGLLDWRCDLGECNEHGGLMPDSRVQVVTGVSHPWFLSHLSFKDEKVG